MNSLRLSGMASGMDTESMVKELMKAQRARLDKFSQSKQTMLWRQEAYQNVNKDFANFVLDMKKELELTKSTIYGTSYGNSVSNLSWVKKASSSDEKVFTAKAMANGLTGTHKVKVKALATGVNTASTAAVEKLDGKQATNVTALSDLGVAAGEYSLVFDMGDGKQATVTYKDTDTIQTLTQKINTATTGDSAKTPLMLQASFDNTSGRLFLATKGIGEKANINVVSDSQNLFKDPNSIFHMVQNDVTGATKGTDAEIDFDGAAGLKYSSNSILINGIQIDLKSADPSKEYTIQVDTDVDGVYNKIKGFVDKYNELIDKMNGKIGEKKYRSYQPLTAEQKEAMKEEDIKNWEIKAKSGLLRSDEHISSALQSMRSGLYEKVVGDSISDAFNHISSLGITTGDYKNKGKLEIDERKLKEAISKDVDGVLNLLFKQSVLSEADGTEGLEGKAKENKIAENKKQIRSESGLITRLFDDIVAGMKNIINKSGTGDNADLYRNVKTNILIDFVTGKETGMGSISFIEQDILKIDKTMDREQNRVSQMEDSYWRKFTAMEKAMQQMNSQSSWLAQQLGGGR